MKPTEQTEIDARYQALPRTVCDWSTAQVTAYHRHLVFWSTPIDGSYLRQPRIAGVYLLLALATLYFAMQHTASTIVATFVGLVLLPIAATGMPRLWPRVLMIYNAPWLAAFCAALATVRLERVPTLATGGAAADIEEQVRTAMQTYGSERASRRLTAADVTELHDLMCLIAIKMLLA